MLKLPEDRLDCPLVEPSQRVCPHWSCVVLHQAARELVYMSLEVGRKCSKCVGVTSSADHIEYEPITSPMRSLTATKRVCFVRHGQGAHNQTIKNWGLIDPELTLEGEAQVWPQGFKHAPLPLPPRTRCHHPSLRRPGRRFGPDAMLPITDSSRAAPARHARFHACCRSPTCTLG